MTTLTFFTPNTVQSQYAASPNILALIESLKKNLPDNDIQLFFEKIFNIQTAEGIGLDIWGIILGVGREIKVEVTEGFGFIGSKLAPFNQAPFMSKGLTDIYTMTDQAYREMLLIKALANISAADLSTLNALLAQLFTGNEVYVIEQGIMQLRFIFEFYPTPYQRALFNIPGVLTSGAGVGVEWLSVPKKTFGFVGSNFKGFDQGTFSQSIPVTVT